MFKNLSLSLFILSIGLLPACNSLNANKFNHDTILKNQIGMLRWGGSPAADGSGMLFIVDEVEYGASGTPEDYPDLFEENEYEIEVEADFKVTGGKTGRGWGATYPEIEFLRIERM